MKTSPLRKKSPLGKYFGTPCLLLAISLAFGCTPQPLPEIPEPISAEDIVAIDTDFECLNNWPQVGRVSITNLAGATEEALELLSNPQIGLQFPIGTIIQEIPEEAMVKRAPGYNPSHNDWEFFALKIENDGSTIIQQRGPNSANLGGTCAGCHVLAKDFDLLCGSSGERGCVDLDFIITDETVVQLRNEDPRCFN